jgi:membrane protein YdbS with pleckstrin-like domain
MNENPTPTPPEQNPSSEPAAPTSRRELRAETSATAPGPLPPKPADPDVAVPAAGTSPQDPGASGASADDAHPGVRAGVVPPPAAPSAPDFRPANPPLHAPAALDDGTFDGIREPRRQGLALDGTWHQISRKYVVSQVVQNLFWIVVVLAAAAVITVVSGQPWAWIPAGVIALFTLVSLAILPRQAKALGYMMRGDDVVFRKGILWQRMVAVPYGRMQLIDITHGPLDRVFGVSKLKMVTAAASTGIEIPGLTTAGAEALRDTLIEVAETRRTGL